MKNVVIFQDFVNGVTYGHQWQQEELFRYFRAQIDNNLSIGWNPKDIIICTNLEFEYKDIQIIKLEHECKFNKYFNKQYGIWELLDKGIIDEPFWFHDFDDWALNLFEFPEFEGDIGMCRYIDGREWNTGSIFVKPESIDIWKFIIDFMKEHRKNPAVDNKGDENVVNLVYKIYPFLQFRFSLLNNQYNVGCTQFESRYNSAIKPINVGAFKPDEFDGINKFIDKNLVSSELLNIFKKHKISC
jgi:hypothetical protein|tara:strand:+ start:2550 stop:3278 length:729 start_codon:yes stop_codon:yes gene_type:complete